MENFYSSGEYSSLNPTWDIGDSFFKYQKIKEILIKNNLNFQTICEVGCGAGEILSLFRKDYPKIDIYGYDIADGLNKFWENKKDLKLYNSNFIEENKRKYDLIFFSDVIEHLDNPFDYLNYAKENSKYIIIYLPLDLSIKSLLFNKALNKQINTVGHINFYTKDIFIDILKHKKFNILDFKFNQPYKRNINKMSIKNFFIYKIRYFIKFFFSNNLYSIIFGGETITILIKS